MTARAEGIPTGYAELDQLISGIPRSAITCLAGSPTCGKTTLVLDVLTRVQEAGEVTVYIDPPGTLDLEYAERRGIDLERLLLVQPQPPALGLEIARDIVSSGGAGLVVLDISAGLGVAPELSHTLRQLSAAVRRSPYALVCLTEGPDIIRAELHLRVERQRWRMDAAGVSGYDTRLTVVRSRFGPPGQSVNLPIMLRSSL
ncbi:MAG: DNA recombination/repair protein RecA [Chloroflexi bacterium]|nr:DNA recombination/repair protein RecA [Chloroflexota bacterium]